VKQSLLIAFTANVLSLIKSDSDLTIDSFMLGYCCKPWNFYFLI